MRANWLVCFIFVAGLMRPAWAVPVSRETLWDDQPLMAAFDARIQALVKSGDAIGLEALGMELLGPSQQWHSGIWKISRYFRVLGMEDDQRNLDEQSWRDRNQFLEQWNKSMPKSYIARLAEATFWYHFAWHARGRGFSNTVTEEGRNVFKERLIRAEKWLEKAGSLKTMDVCPFYYELAIGLGNSQNRDKASLEKIYEACRNRFPKYFQISEAMDWALLPRWGGEKQLGMVFQKELDRDPMVAVWGISRKMNHIAQDSDGMPWMVLGFPTKDSLWAALQGGIFKIDSTYPQSVQNLNLFVILADQMGLPQETMKWMRRLEGRMDFPLWRDKSDPDRFKELDLMSKEIISGTRSATQSP